MTTSAPTAPVDQATFWNEEGGRRWVENIERVEYMLAPLAARVLALAAPRAGERVLDVGCGGGRTSAACAAAVGPTGQVLGVDVSAVILEVARARFADVANLVFELGDAATMPFAGFDLVTSRFGVMFFPEPTTAFANLRRALKPGGRLAFICWRSLEENPWMADCVRAAFTVLPPPEPTPPGAPGPFAFADGERLRGILAAAGFGAIEINPHEETLNLGSLDQAVEQLTRMGPAAAAFAAADATARAALVEALREVLAPRLVTGCVEMSSATWLVHAREL